MINKYFAQKDAIGFPIPGTMMGFETTPTSAPDLVEVSGFLVKPGDPYTEPSGKVEVTHPEGIRYFVRADKKGNVIPNTLIIGTRVPSGDVLEFHLMVAVGTVDSVR